MAGPTTTNYSWQLPEVGASDDTWGDELNAALEAVDGQVKSNDDAAAAAQTTADAALPKAGGTMTGNTKVFTSTGTVTALGVLTTTVDIDMALSNIFTCSFSAAGATTVNVPTNFPASGTFGWFILKITNGAARTSGFTWNSVFKWVSGTAPALTANTDTIIAYTTDGGATFQAAYILGHA